MQIFNFYETLLVLLRACQIHLAIHDIQLWSAILNVGPPKMPIKEPNTGSEGKIICSRKVLDHFEVDVSWEEAHHGFLEAFYGVLLEPDLHAGILS